ncbi:hypothetical protein KSE_05370 [Kitasatospora setae KM-6054]|uniref:Uncharacterized protein n=1 Tax=Kitasatospora setae (strain ATCC 33774 / DSM 43861 / JCM 3304 / KCC A-0304 / NBRC 14216 / KM-6054) TaxID=452652 RepID=E4N5A2_KITSK|nr:hypothetical protein KSE_05370 [Kitasatospora setae KM-6054]
MGRLDEAVTHGAGALALCRALATAIGGVDPTGPMSCPHAEIQALTGRLLAQDAADPAGLAEPRLTMYGLYAVLGLHTLQEEESHLSPADTAPRPPDRPPGGPGGPAVGGGARQSPGKGSGPSRIDLGEQCPNALGVVEGVFGIFGAMLDPARLLPPQGSRPSPAPTVALAAVGTAPARESGLADCQVRSAKVSIGLSTPCSTCPHRGIEAPAAARCRSRGEAVGMVPG